MERSAVILAAGQGTRMKSDRPKGLHEVAGVPMVELIGRALRDSGVSRPIVVIGHGGDQIQTSLGEKDYAFVWQHERLGTGHAAQMALPALEGVEGSVIVAPGDTPLLDANVFAELLDVHEREANGCTLASAVAADPRHYGRVVRDADEQVSGIVEFKDASPEIRAIREVNAAVYCFNVAALREALNRLEPSPVTGEFYLTDVIHHMRAAGLRCQAVQFDEFVLMGVNDRWELAQANEAMRLRLVERHAKAGVTVIDPNTTYIGLDVEIGVDTVLLPGTHLEGRTTIGRGCQIGPYSRVVDSQIADRCTILMSHVSGTVMEEDSRCGPYANLRPGSQIGPKVKIGNFVEVKNVTLGAGVAASHLSYLGDGSVGAGSNIGAGTIFCNYDGFRKHRTQIGENVFVGSNSTLVAPLIIGDGAIIAAGSAITRDVEPNALAIGRTRQEVKEAWAEQWREKKKSEPTGK